MYISFSLKNTSIYIICGKIREKIFVTYTCLSGYRQKHANDKILISFFYNRFGGKIK